MRSDGATKLREDEVAEQPGTHPAFGSAGGAELYIQTPTLPLRVSAFALSVICGVVDEPSILYAKEDRHIDAMLGKEFVAEREPADEEPSRPQPATVACWQNAMLARSPTGFEDPTRW